ncbi:MAG: 2-amino-4-hydroxy-6-hydroxymethyldihydropteridine diphosphokinase [Ignavibacteria bacterium]|nr:2-amino-4-hydroxy-6-hydroxymethyldihydropteridine diphosphokinase [Ignavibacteria bacterium]
MKENVFLGLGSNVGDRLEFIELTIDYIRKNKSIKFLKSSLIYETEPWGIKDQNKFLNCAVKIETDLTPSELLKFIKDTEEKVGRKKRGKWLEREIDIDILFYGDLIYDGGGLKIPHGEIQNRKFVLKPMLELAPDFTHPVLFKTMKKLYADTRDKSDVKIYKTKK